MLEPIYTGVTSHCLGHPNVPVAPNERWCGDCKEFQAKTSINVPFDVRCNNTAYGCKKGEIYQVTWVIRNGAREYNQSDAGYVFFAQEDGEKKFLLNHIFDVKDFTPVAWLPKDEQPEKKEDVMDWDMLG